MRFAWLREKTDDDAPVKPSLANRLTFIAYNVIWWLPILLGFTKIIEYHTAFTAFLVITIIRAIANVIRNNLLTLEQAEVFPFRAP
jgi:hypothetical protein